ncbi:MAG TPA: class I SAM-dependent methyltransferase [Nitratidesulfovibrio sp.]|nr:class I SAM-dependent methyltransferase [Nitratidesulfovibrio sp.]
MGRCATILNTMPRLRGILLDGVLRLHNACYIAASRLAVLEGGGTHPKHRIQDYHQWFLEHISPGSSVLDIGCGTGNLSRTLSAKASRVLGVDIVPANIHAAQRTPHASNIEYLCADATTLNMSGHAVDHVVLSNVLEHIQDRVTFLRSITPLLAGGATLLLRVPMVDRDWLTPFKRERGVEWRLDPTHYTEYTEDELLAELAAAGLALMGTPRVRFGEFYGVIVPSHQTGSASA